MGEKLKSFEKLFWKKASERIEKGEKFLGVFSRKFIKDLEHLIGTDLGSKAGKEGMGRKRRPFIARYEHKECRYFTAFLTTKPYSRIFVNLDPCGKKERGLCTGLESNCFVLKDRKRGQALLYGIPKERFEEFEFELCGFCHNMDVLERLKLEVID